MITPAQLRNALVILAQSLVEHGTESHLVFEVLNLKSGEGLPVAVYVGIGPAASVVIDHANDGMRETRVLAAAEN